MKRKINLTFTLDFPYKTLFLFHEIPKKHTIIIYLPCLPLKSSETEFLATVCILGGNVLATLADRLRVVMTGCPERKIRSGFVTIN